jgi:hypothetical protein
MKIIAIQDAVMPITSSICSAVIDFSQMITQSQRGSPHHLIAHPIRR